MPTMNISLPEELKSFVDERVSASTYSTNSEYIRELIRQDQQRAAEKKLAGLIAEGLNSEPTAPIDQSYWAEKRALGRKLTRA
jgi:antitoxin ParD1/3/4